VTGALSKRDFAIAAAVVAGVTLLYARAIGFAFINIDDGYYVYGNDVVARGLTWDGLRYAFTSTSEGNYLPLTWLSHMVVVEFFGTGPAGHHAANVVLHALTAGSFFLFLRLAGGTEACAAAAAALWAAHPLRVESVAWVAERKDVLSGLLFVWGLIAYLDYARRGGWARYGIVLGVFGLGLLSKSIVVTLPCILLLLDLWPLDRARPQEPGRGRRATRLVAEKIPLLLGSVAMGLVTLWAQASMGSVTTLDRVPIGYRLWNAAAAHGVYAMQAVWPVRLGVFYPYPEAGRLYLLGGLGFAILVLATAAALYRFNRQPYLLVGWLWVVCALAPVIGLMQVGTQAHADRYTYLPHMGLWMAVVWAGATALRRASWRVPLSLSVLLFYIILTWNQIGHWRDSAALFAHTLRVTGPNNFAERNYGSALIDAGRYAKAEVHLRRAVAIEEGWYRDAQLLGIALTKQGRTAEGRDQFERALMLNPGHGPTWVLLGNANLTLGEPRRGIDAYREARRLGEGSADFYTNFGIALAMEGRKAEAEAEFRQALMRAPDHVPALFNSGVLALERRDAALARDYFRRVLELDPGHEAARAGLDALEAPAA